MSEADVVYSDVMFKSKGGNSGVASPSAETTYSEVRMLKAQPSRELPAGSQQQAVSKVPTERVAIAVLGALLAAAVIALGFTSFKNIETTQHLQKLTAVNKNLTERCSAVQTCNTCPKPPVVEIKPCLKCKEGWEQHGGKCYYFSTGASTWEQSRHECRQIGGDLVKIDSREEQSFLSQKLTEEMNKPEDKFWIGLTDSKTEGMWLWVDDTPLNESLRFWRRGEPDNWEREDSNGEDCARMGEKAGSADLMCWFDKSCMTPHRRICEKPAERGVSQCV